MSRLAWTACVGLILASQARAQAPDKARLDQTLNLQSPGTALSAGDEFLVAGTDKGTLEVWRKDVWLGIRTPGTSSFSLSGHEGPVVALVQRGGTAVSSGADGQILVWDLAEGELVQKITPAGLVRAMAIAPDGSVLATGGEKNLIELWEFPSGKALGSLTGHTDWITSLAFSPDGKVMASGGLDGVVRIWNLAEKKQQLTMTGPPPPANAETPPLNFICCLSFTADGKQMAFGMADGLIHLAGLTDGKIVRSFPPHASSATAIHFNNAGKFLFSASKDRTIRICDAGNAQVLKILEGHTAWVHGIVPLAQELRLASVSADRTVRVWDFSGK